MRNTLMHSHVYTHDFWSSLIYSNYKVGNEKVILNYAGATAIWKILSCLYYIENLMIDLSLPKITHGRTTQLTSYLPDDEGKTLCC